MIYVALLKFNSCHSRYAWLWGHVLIVGVCNSLNGFCLLLSADFFSCLLLRKHDFVVIFLCYPFFVDNLLVETEKHTLTLSETMFLKLKLFCVHCSFVLFPFRLFRVSLCSSLWICLSKTPNCEVLPLKGSLRRIKDCFSWPCCWWHPNITTSTGISLSLMKCKKKSLVIMLIFGKILKFCRQRKIQNNLSG